MEINRIYLERYPEFLEFQSRTRDAEAPANDSVASVEDVATSTFSASAVQTARDLGSRIVLIDRVQLAKLLIRYNIGCWNEEVIHLRKIDEDYFEYGYVLIENNISSATI